jgi:Flp pilus assembly protein TadD
MKTILTISLLLAVAACEKTDGASKATPNASAGPVGSGTLSSVGAPAKPASELPVTTSNPQALEAYKLGFEAFNNAHADEARELFTKAVSLDPKFVTAIGMQGAATPGPDGVKLLADAVAQSSGLPEAERVHLQLAQAFAARDYAKAVDLGKKLTELVPGASAAHFLQGRALAAFGKREDALTAFKKASELDPTAGLPYNDLAYDELALGRPEDALAHFKKYAELSPREANAQDSLGEALLMNGNYDDAEAAYKRAIDLSSKFILSWEGLGMTRLYKGDWAGAYEAFGRLREASPTIEEKGTAFRDAAWGQLAQGKPADAMKTLDAWDAEVAKTKDTAAVVGATLSRAGILLESKHEADALKLLLTLTDKIDKGEAPLLRKVAWKSYARAVEIIAQARLGKTADAEKTLAAVLDLIGKSEEAEQKGLVAFVQGEAALAKGDAKAAADAFSACTATDDYCTWERAKALEKSGDKTAAAATRDRMLKTHRRDPLAFFVWSKSAPVAPVAPGVAAKK